MCEFFSHASPISNETCLWLTRYLGFVKEWVGGSRVEIWENPLCYTGYIAAYHNHDFAVIHVEQGLYDQRQEGNLNREYKGLVCTIETDAVIGLGT